MSYSSFPSFTDRDGVRAAGDPSAVSAPLHLVASDESSLVLGGAKDDSSVATKYASKIARQILNDQVTVQPIDIGGAWGLDLSNESCELCGGFFPTKDGAAAMMFLTRYGEPRYLHVGCEMQAEEWR